MSVLTPAERKTLNRAFEILSERTPEGASWYPSIHKGWRDLTYFTALKTQMSSIPGKTFADKVQAALDQQTKEDANADLAKENRIAELQRQLVSLTGGAA